MNSLRFIILLSMGCVIVLAGMLSYSRRAEPHTTWVYYNVYDQNEFHLYRANPNNPRHNKRISYGNYDELVTWTPDGKQAIVAAYDGQWHLNRLNPSGGIPTRLFTVNDGSFFVRWIDDWLYYQTTVPRGFSLKRFHIVTEAQESLLPPEINYETLIDVTDQTIYFVREVDYVRSIFRADADGITPIYTLDSGDIVQVRKPNTEAFIVRDAVGILIYVDEQERIPLTDSEGNDFFETWYGDSIIFSSRRGGNTDLYQVQVGEPIQQLTNTEGNTWFEAWLDDGETMLINSGLPGGERNLFLFHVPTQQLTLISDNIDTATFATWFPSGEDLLIAAYDGNNKLYQINLMGEIVQAFPYPDGDKQFMSLAPLVTLSWRGGIVLIMASVLLALAWGYGKVMYT